MRKDKKVKDNPFLMCVNHPIWSNSPKFVYDDCGKELYQEALELMPNLSEEKFIKALKQFWQQHFTLPTTISLEDIPGLDEKEDIMIKVGNAGQIFYTPDKVSRKAAMPNNPAKKKTITYHHETADKLLTNPDGKVLIYTGKTYMKDDGWLHD